jgi:hypothetical protein
MDGRLCTFTPKSGVLQTTTGPLVARYDESVRTGFSRMRGFSSRIFLH